MDKDNSLDDFGAMTKDELIARLHETEQKNKELEKERNQYREELEKESKTLAKLIDVNEGLERDAELNEPLFKECPNQISGSSWILYIRVEEAFTLTKPWQRAMLQHDERPPKLIEVSVNM